MLASDGGGRTVLDVGCGNGYLAAAVAKRDFQVTGVERAGGYTADFPESVGLIEADLDQGLPALYAQFDYVICADIIEHLREPANLLRELRAVVKPGGCLVASLPNSGHIYFRFQVALGRFPRHDQGLFDRTHLHFYTWAGWNQLFAAGGFRIESVEVTSVPFERALAPANTSSKILRAAEWFSFQLARAWKTLFAYQFVVAAVPDDETGII
jgi:methionine biosynthesis protein MetW